MTDNHTRVLRFEIPVDDQAHDIGDGLPLMAHPWRSATSTPAGRVEIWIEARVPAAFPAADHRTRQAQVFGTGHIIPDGASWLVSCIDGTFVWHVYDVTGVQ